MNDERVGSVYRWRGLERFIVVGDSGILERDALRRATDLILDAEPLLVHWSESPDLLPARLASLLTRVPVSAVVCSNSRRFRYAGPGVALVSGARKPWTRLSRFGALGDRPVVIGDLLLLDGLLAARLGATFYWVRPDGDIPVWPRVLGLLDRVVLCVATVALQGDGEHA